MSSPAVPEPPIVDTHAHIFTMDMPRSDSAWFEPQYGFTAEQYLALLDRHGIHFGVIAGISIYGLYNDYMIEQLRRYRRLRGTANVAATTDRYTLERMRSDGIVGIRLQLTRREELPNLASEEYRLLLRRLADLDMHVEVIVEGPRCPQVLELLEASGVKIVVDHFGHPDPLKGVRCAGFQAVLRSIERGRTWVKLSAGYRLTWAKAGQATRDTESLRLAQELAQSLLQNAGAERLLWGSDCPFVGHESAVSFDDTLEELARWVPDGHVRRRISDTALRLYFG